MSNKDSSTASRAAALHEYWLLTVLEDRAESAMPPPMPDAADDVEDAR